MEVLVRRCHFYRKVLQGLSPENEWSKLLQQNTSPRIVVLNRVTNSAVLPRALAYATLFDLIHVTLTRDLLVMRLFAS